MLSASPIDGRPFFDLGPSDGVAWDQPRVTVQFIDAQENIIGPQVFNTWLLDTGANTILGFQTAIGDMTGPPPYQTVGKFEELGVGGRQTFDISATYRFDFAGDSGVRNTRLNTRMISDATRDVSIFGPYGIVGMPAMTERVTTLDFTPWTTIDPQNLNLFMRTEFRSDVPEYSGPRYSIKLDNRFRYFPDGHEVPRGIPLPSWSDIPYLSAELLHNDKTTTGNFIFDTGAQVSILNRRMAMELGLDTNNDGELDNRDASFARFETVSGVGGTANVPVFLIDEVHVPSEQGPDLVWTDLQWLVLDIDPGIDAVFGFDNMTSGWIEAVAVNGKSGYILQSHLDFRGYETTGQGRIYLDINPEIHAVVDPNGPGAIVEESGGLTSISEIGVSDTYTLRLATRPAANVRVSLSSPNDQQALAVDAVRPDRNFLEFTPDNWNVPQTVRVTAIDDSTQESFHRSFIRHISTSSDPAYNAVGMPRVVVNITDNDYPGVTLIPSQGATEVSEGGSGDSYQIVLTYAPTQPVTISLSNIQNQVSATALGGGTSLVFTPSNWNVPQTVFVAAVDDNLAEGDHKTYISHSLTTTDLNYQEAFVLQEIVQIHDNDLADSTPPRIVDVQVGSSRWTNQFVDAVDGGGIGAGNKRGLSLVGAHQTRNLPWPNIDRVYIQFSEAIATSLTPNQFAVVGTNAGNYLPGISVEYGVDGPNVATLKFASPLANDSLVISLRDTLTDAAGNRLDGEWLNDISTSSGNGTAGGQFNFRLDVLPGDVNNNGGVNTGDLFDIYDNLGKLVGSLTDAWLDVSANGGVSTGDMFDAYDWLGRVLPATPPSPVLALSGASVSPSYPNTSPSNLSRMALALPRQNETNPLLRLGRERLTLLRNAAEQVLTNSTLSTPTPLPAIQFGLATAFPDWDGPMTTSDFWQYASDSDLQELYSWIDLPINRSADHVGKSPDSTGRSTPPYAQTPVTRIVEKFDLDSDAPDPLSLDDAAERRRSKNQFFRSF